MIDLYVLAFCISHFMYAYINGIFAAIFIFVPDRYAGALCSGSFFMLTNFCILHICFNYYSYFTYMISWSFARAIRHPASGYVQGINDLVTPFLVVFLSEHLEGGIDNWAMSDLSPDKISNIEADCYWCLSKLLDGMQDHYTFAQPGIQRLVFKLKELVRRIDGNVVLRPFIFLSSISIITRTCMAYFCIWIWFCIILPYIQIQSDMP